MWAAVEDEGRGRCATVVDDGKGKWEYVCRSGTRVGADGRIWVTVQDEGRGRWTHMGSGG